MPARVVRAEINASDSLSRVSLEADLVFRSLIVVVDDYGRMDARLPILKAAIFPLRGVSLDDLCAWLDELCVEGCVERYEVDGRPYIRLTGWERHRGKGRRGKDSKYPDPEDNPRNGTHFLGSESVSEEKQSLLRRQNLASSEMHADPPVVRSTRDVGRGTTGARATTPTPTDHEQPPEADQPPDPRPAEAAERHRAVLAEAQPTVERFREPRFGIERAHWELEYARLAADFGWPVVEKALARLAERKHWQAKIRDPKSWWRNRAIEQAAAEVDAEQAAPAGRAVEAEALRREELSIWGY